MQVVIAGAGEVGFNLIQNLYRDHVKVLVVDSDEAILKKLSSLTNIKTEFGNITDHKVLQKCDLKNTDLFIAITNFDETNMIACQMAKELGAKKTISRIRYIRYDTFDKTFSLSSLGVDNIMNPVDVIANELYRLVQAPNSVESHDFFEGDITLIGFHIRKNANILKYSIQKLIQTLPKEKNIYLSAIQRENQTFFPNISITIEESDIVYFFCPFENIQILRNFLYGSNKKEGLIFINGGGYVGYQLASMLEKSNYKVKIIEKNREKCKRIAERLQNTLVLNFDGTDSKRLKAEGIYDSEYFFSVTNNEHVNIISSMIACEFQVKYPVSLVKQPEYVSILEKNSSIYLSISPRVLSAHFLSRFIHGEYVTSYFSIMNSSTEFIELQISQAFAYKEIPLKDFEIIHDIHISLIRRDEVLMLPTINTYLMEGDYIVVMLHKFDRTKVLNFFHVHQ